MAVRLIILMSWVIILMMCLPSNWFPAGCTIAECYKGVACSHTVTQFGHYSWFEGAKESVRMVVKALAANGDYQKSNAIAYLGLVPSWAILNAWLHRLSWKDYIGMILSVLIMYGMGHFSPPVGSMREGGWFEYCTEWCMRLANVTGLTYGGVCFVIFVVAIPSVLLGDFLWALWKRRMNRVHGDNE